MTDPTRITEDILTQVHTLLSGKENKLIQEVLLCIERECPKSKQLSPKGKSFLTPNHEGGDLLYQ